MIKLTIEENLYVITKEIPNGLYTVIHIVKWKKDLSAYTTSSINYFKKPWNSELVHFKRHYLSIFQEMEKEK